MRYPKLNPEIRRFVEYQIASYPEKVKELNELQHTYTPRITPAYIELGGRSNAATRPTEAAALKLTTNEYIAMLAFSVNAIRSVYDRLSSENRELIRLMYWSNYSFNMEGIAQKLNIERSGLYRRLNLILIEFARRLGYVNLF